MFTLTKQDLEIAVREAEAEVARLEKDGTGDEFIYRTYADEDGEPHTRRFTKMSEAQSRLTVAKLNQEHVPQIQARYRKRMAKYRHNVDEANLECTDGMSGGLSRDAFKCALLQDGMEEKRAERLLRWLENSQAHGGLKRSALVQDREYSKSEIALVAILTTDRAEHVYGTPYPVELVVTDTELGHWKVQSTSFEVSIAE